MNTDFKLLKKAWCFVPYEPKRSRSFVLDGDPMGYWTEGYVLPEKRIAVDCKEYTLFLDYNKQIWYVSYEATISYKDPYKL